MKNNKNTKNIVLNTESNIKENMNQTDFDTFLKSLLNHNKSKYKQNMNKLILNQNNYGNHMFGNNYKNTSKKSIDNININKIETKTKANKRTRNNEMLYSTFSTKTFLTLEQLIELKNETIKNINNSYKNIIKNKNNTISNISPEIKNNIINKSSKKLSKFNSNYNLLLTNKFNNIINNNNKNILNIKKINIQKKKTKSRPNLNDIKLFETYNNNNYALKEKIENNITSNNISNFGELMSSLKNTFKEIEDADKKINKNNINNNKVNKNKNNHYKRNQILIEKEKNKSYLNDITLDKIKINNFHKNINRKNNQKKLDINKYNKNDLVKLNKEKINNLDRAEKIYKKLNTNTTTTNIKTKNYSCPNNLNNIKMNDKHNIKNNKSNITMNNNYIFNNIQNKYNLTSFSKKEKLNNNIYSKTYNNFNRNSKDFISPKKNISKKYDKNQIIKIISFYYNKDIGKDTYKNININLRDINMKRINQNILLFFIGIINAYKDILLKQKKTEKLLYKEINEKNNEIKKLKIANLKIFYFFEKERNNIDNFKDTNLKRIAIIKQLIEENKYLRNIIMSKDNININSNFYSSYDGSYEGLLGIMEKGIAINNKLKTKNIISKNGTANNSPQLSKREDVYNEDFLLMNSKKKLFQNFYILKKNRKEI